jgi:hypothetical protein
MPHRSTCAVRYVRSGSVLVTNNFPGKIHLGKSKEPAYSRTRTIPDFSCLHKVTADHCIFKLLRFRHHKHAEILVGIRLGEISEVKFVCFRDEEYFLLWEVSLAIMPSLITY